MAKPIRATPTLKGIEAITFIKEVLEEERRPSKARVNMIREAAKIKFRLR